MHSAVKVIESGYSRAAGDNEYMEANCSVTLIVDTLGNRTLVDTLTAWDKERLLGGLRKEGVNSPEQIDFLVCTHGHSDHVGNNNLFTTAKAHFLGQCISHKNKYFFHNFKDSAYKISDDVEVIATPGHTLSCVSVIVRNATISNGSDPATIAVVGDLFEKEEDINDKSIWLEAGSENESDQITNRLKIAEIADIIIPGHGPPFHVTERYREKLRTDVQQK